MSGPDCNLGDLARGRPPMSRYARRCRANGLTGPGPSGHVKLFFIRGGSSSPHLEPPNVWKNSPGSRSSARRPRSASSGSGKRPSVRRPRRAWIRTSPASFPAPSRRWSS